MVGIIPARSKSKRLPHKNIKWLHRFPLMAYTITRALKTQTLDRVIVSTDSKYYMKIARTYGAEAFRQPIGLSGDSDSLLRAIQFCVRKIERYEKVDIVAILQPTSPFRTSEDIDKAVYMLMNTLAESVISVCEVSEPPQWMFYIFNEGKMISFLGVDKTQFNNGEMMQNKLPKLFLPNGAIYVVRRNCLMQQNRIYGKDCRAYIMPVERSLDIDTENDFKLAEFLIQKAMLKK